MHDNLTQILNDPDKNKIMPKVYDELMVMARAALRRNRRYDTLDTSAVVHESVIKFYGSQAHHFKSRGHFYALMSKIMRELIIDYARSKNAQIRGGGLEKVTLSGLGASDDKLEVDVSHVLDMDKAMTELAEFDKILEQMMIMKFYGGLKISELAQCFNTSESSIKRDIRTARAFMKSRLKDY